MTCFYLGSQPSKRFLFFPSYYYHHHYRNYQRPQVSSYARLRASMKPVTGIQRSEFSFLVKRPERLVRIFCQSACFGCLRLLMVLFFVVWLFVWLGWLFELFDLLVGFVVWSAWLFGWLCCLALWWVLLFGWFDLVGWSVFQELKQRLTKPIFLHFLLMQNEGLRRYLPNQDHKKHCR